MIGDFFLTEWFFLGMRWLYENLLSNNIFLTILVSTVLLRALTVFSDIKQRKSTAKMQKIQPEIERLKQKYEKDPQKFQQQQSKLMKENGVSMFGGCLPMLITLPLFFCFIAAFRFWGYEQNVKILLEMDRNITVAEETGKDVAISETFKNSKFLWINNVWQPDNGMADVVVSADAFLKYENLEKLYYFKENPKALERMKELKLIEFSEKEKDVAKNEYNKLVAPIQKEYDGYSNGWFVLPVVAAAMQFLYAYVSQKRQGVAAQQQQAGGKFMIYLFPAMSFVFCLSNSAAFSLYWALSSMVMFIIMLLLNKFLKSDDDTAVITEP